MALTNAEKQARCLNATLVSIARRHASGSFSTPHQGQDDPPGTPQKLYNNRCDRGVGRERRAAGDHHFSASAFTSAPSGDPKSEPPDVLRCYRASVAPVLAAAAEMFLGAWQHGIVGEYPVNLYL
jgi:hypothetical protein